MQFLHAAIRDAMVVRECASELHLSEPDQRQCSLHLSVVRRLWLACAGRVLTVSPQAGA